MHEVRTRKRTSENKIEENKEQRYANKHAFKNEHRLHKFWDAENRTGNLSAHTYSFSQRDLSPYRKHTAGGFDGTYSPCSANAARKAGCAGQYKKGVGYFVLPVRKCGFGMLSNIYCAVCTYPVHTMVQTFSTISRRKLVALTLQELV